VFETSPVIKKHQEEEQECIDLATSYLMTLLPRAVELKKKLGISDMAEVA